MNHIYQKVVDCYESIKERIPFTPKVALVLGSGLGNYADTMDVKAEIDYSEIKDFPVSTVPGHAGKFIFGYVGEVPVVCMKGRVHYYEGYPITDVVLPTRLMKMMGAEILFLTNASGGINKNFEAGSFMMITDHISSFVQNPLIGPNIDEFGTRFPDMSEVYSTELVDMVKKIASRLGIDTQEGVYMALTGPSYETPAEVKMARIVGADAVGMSTVPEAIVAKWAGMNVIGISCICNSAAGVSTVALSHDDVIHAANVAKDRFKVLVKEVVREL